MKLNGKLTSKLLFTLKNEIATKFPNSFIGLYWIILNPVIQTSIYLFIFTYVFQIKFNLNENSNNSYLIYCLSGLIVWFPIVDILNNSASLFEKKRNLIKNFDNSLYFYPIVVVVISLFPFLVVSIFLIILNFDLDNLNIIALMFLILYFFFFILLITAISFFISCIGVIFGDLKYMLPFFIQIMLLLTPVFYMVDSMPSIMQKISKLNPLFYVIYPFQKIIYFNEQPEYLFLFMYGLFSSTLLIISIRFFSYVKNYITDIV